MKGRKPKLKLVEGGRPAHGCPAAPSWMTRQAKAEWRRSAPQVHDRGHLTDDTKATLESYCVAVGTVRECEEVMIREGRFLDTEEGPKPHPAFRMQSAAMREARLLASELALTPHRRANKATGNEEPDGWDADLLA